MRLPYFALFALVVGSPGVAQGQAALSRFAGSVEKGVYETDFGTLAYAKEVSRTPDVERVEGALVSRVFTKPGDKSNLEVFRSYQRELENGGFTTVLAAESGGETELMARALYSGDNTPSFGARAYRPTEGQVRAGDLARLGTQADYYLVARRTDQREERWVSVILARYEDLYMVEELTVEAMEAGTVTLNLDAIRSAIEASGSIAVYDIHFATGSATIEAESAAALEVIAAYLGEANGSFYIVGHTDDTGSLDQNLELSQARAAAVKEALVSAHGVDPSRLETRGVGPLSPVSTNTADEGRALNRRVEIVERLQG